jgi:hypothetical protein
VIAVSELPANIREFVDLNSDGVVDYRDVERFEAENGLPNLLSAKMRVSLAKQEGRPARSLP